MPFRRIGQQNRNKKRKADEDSVPASGTISSLVPQAHDQERLNVFLDGSFAFGISALVATRAGLRVGKLLSALDVSRLRGEESIESAFESALNFLSYRARSEDEVRRNLEQKGILPDVIDAVMERLKRTRLVDDQAFADYWMKQRQTHSPRSSRALRHELRQKGVSADHIENAIESINQSFSEDSADNPDSSEPAGDARHSMESDAAYRAAQKKAAQLVRQGVDYQIFRRKLGGFLGRRGFSYGTITPVMRRLWDEHSGGEAADEGFVDDP